MHASAANTALAAVHTVKKVTQSTSLLVEATAARTPIITSGKAQGRKRRIAEGEGKFLKRGCFYRICTCLELLATPFR